MPDEIGIGRDQRREGRADVGTPAGVRALDRAAELALEYRGRGADDAPHLGIDRRVAPVLAIGDAQAPDVASYRVDVVEVGCRDRVAVARIGTGDHAEHQRGVRDGAAHRPDMLERSPSSTRRDSARRGSPG